MLKQSQRKLISSFNLTNGTLITPLFNFYWDLGLQCTKIHRLVQYTPRKVINSFVQSVVDTRRATDESPLSGVVAETMKLIGNSSYDYQKMDRSKHTMTKYLGDEKSHKVKFPHYGVTLRSPSTLLYMMRSSTQFSKKNDGPIPISSRKMGNMASPASGAVYSIQNAEQVSAASVGNY